MSQTKESIVLAGGCFWGVEELFRSFPGVLDTQVGYTGGHTENPTYEDVKSGKSGHAEALRILYDTQQTDLSKIFAFFFKLHDPTTRNRQGNDIGSQYRSAIFVANNRERQVAAEAITSAQNSGLWSDQICTTIEDLGDFHHAEEYHQDYLQKHPGGYTCHFIRD